MCRPTHQLWLCLLVLLPSLPTPRPAHTTNNNTPTQSTTQARCDDCLPNQRSCCHPHRPVLCRVSVCVCPSMPHMPLHVMWEFAAS